MSLGWSAVNHYGGCVWPIGNSLFFHWKLIEILVFTDHQPYLPTSAYSSRNDFATDLGKPYELFFVFCFLVKRGGHQYWLFCSRAVLDPLYWRSITDNCRLEALLITAWPLSIVALISRTITPLNFPIGLLGWVIFSVSFTLCVLTLLADSDAQGNRTSVRHSLIGRKVFGTLKHNWY